MTHKHSAVFNLHRRTGLVPVLLEQALENIIKVNVVPAIVHGTPIHQSMVEMVSVCDSCAVTSPTLLYAHCRAEYACLSPTLLKPTYFARSTWPVSEYMLHYFLAIAPKKLGIRASACARSRTTADT